MFRVMKTIFVLGRKTLPHTIIAQIMASSHPKFETYTNQNESYYVATLAVKLNNVTSKVKVCVIIYNSNHRHEHIQTEANKI